MSENIRVFIDCQRRLVAHEPVHTAWGGKDIYIHPSGQELHLSPSPIGAQPRFVRKASKGKSRVEIAASGFLRGEVKETFPVIARWDRRTASMVVDLSPHPVSVNPSPRIANPIRTLKERQVSESKAGADVLVFLLTVGGKLYLRQPVLQKHWRGVRAVECMMEGTTLVLTPYHHGVLPARNASSSIRRCSPVESGVQISIGAWLNKARMRAGGVECLGTFDDQHALHVDLSDVPRRKYTPLPHNPVAETPTPSAMQTRLQQLEQQVVELSAAQARPKPSSWWARLKAFLLT